MAEFLTALGLGLLIIIMGIINMTGNISTLHSYHRHRVSEEDRKPFGKLIGLGTVIIGASLIIFGALSFIAEETGLDFLTVIGVALLITGIVLGLIITFFAMKKYNRGIF